MMFATSWETKEITTETYTALLTNKMIKDNDSIIPVSV